MLLVNVVFIFFKKLILKLNYSYYLFLVVLMCLFKLFFDDFY